MADWQLQGLKPLELFSHAQRTSRCAFFWAGDNLPGRRGDWGRTRRGTRDRITADPAASLALCVRRK